jgi:hypothetical protein
MVKTKTGKVKEALTIFELPVVARKGRTAHSIVLSFFRYHTSFNHIIPSNFSYRNLPTPSSLLA